MSLPPLPSDLREAAGRMLHEVEMNAAESTSDQFLRDLALLANHALSETDGGDLPTPPEPTAWLHVVKQHEADEEDLALSFAPDNFPLMGEAAGLFQSLRHGPLYTADQLRTYAEQYGRLCADAEREAIAEMVNDLLTQPAGERVARAIRARSQR